MFKKYLIILLIYFIKFVSDTFKRRIGEGGGEEGGGAGRRKRPQKYRN